jgi:CheY-like chemotaxis protein
VLLYDERTRYAESIAATLDDLEVSVTIPPKAADFFRELETGRFPFAFVSAGLMAEAGAIIRRLKARTTLVLLAELGETSSFRDVPSIMMPAYVVPIANVLNGLTVNPEIRKTVVRFTAPEARVLIVDDIMTNLKVAQGLLVPYRMQVDICDTGNGAIALVKANHYDLIFMDHMMPGLDGIETTGQIRALEGEYFRRLPVIALTANAVAGMREMFLSKGFNDYLAKPIEISRLNELMEKWIPPDKRLTPESGADNRMPSATSPAETAPPWEEAPPAEVPMDRALLFPLKRALESENAHAIDMALDELLAMPLGASQKKALSEIWDSVLALEFKEAAARADLLA